MKKEILHFFTYAIIGMLTATLIQCHPNNSKKDTKNDLPSGVSYQIIKEEPDEPFSKTSIEIRLNKEVGRDVLTKIAYQIKEQKKKYSKIWIFYYLPEMETGKGAWAITHFTPDLEVEIIGPTKLASEEMNNRKVTGDISGVWIDNDAILPNVKYLVKEDGKLLMKSVYAKTKYVDASELIEQLTKTTYKGQIRYNYKNNHGEFYLVENNGNLSIYDSDGKFKELSKKQ